MAAEGRFLYGPRPTSRQLRYLQTYNTHDTAALCAAGVREMTGNPTAEARLAVPPLLGRTWPAVTSVARTLFTNGEASHGDVCRALGLPDGDRGGPGSTAVAFLTAGLRR